MAKYISLYKHGKINMGLALYQSIITEDGKTVDPNPFKVSAIYLKNPANGVVHTAEEYELGGGYLMTGSRAIQDTGNSQKVLGLDDIIQNSKSWFVKTEEDAAS